MMFPKKSVYFLTHLPFLLYLFPFFMGLNPQDSASSQMYFYFSILLLSPLFFLAFVLLLIQGFKMFHNLKKGTFQELYFYLFAIALPANLFFLALLLTNSYDHQHPVYAAVSFVLSFLVFLLFFDLFYKKSEQERSLSKEFYKTPYFYVPLACMLLPVFIHLYYLASADSLIRQEIETTYSKKGYQVTNFKKSPLFDSNSTVEFDLKDGDYSIHETAKIYNYKIAEERFKNAQANYRDVFSNQAQSQEALDFLNYFETIARTTAEQIGSPVQIATEEGKGAGFNHVRIENMAQLPQPILEIAGQNAQSTDKNIAAFDGLASISLSDLLANGVLIPSLEVSDHRDRAEIYRLIEAIDVTNLPNAYYTIGGSYGFKVQDGQKEVIKN